MKEKRCKILIVSGFFPYPATHGGMVDVWKRIIGIHSLGHTIDLLYTAKEIPKHEDVKYVSEYVREIFDVERKNKIKQLFYRAPLQVTSRDYLKYIKINKKYDYLILEGDYVGEVLENKSLQYKKLVIRSHNNEKVYFKNLSRSTNNFFKKIYYTLESLKFLGYSKELYLKANSIWFISKDEQIKYLNKNRDSKGVWLPTPFSDSEIMIQSIESKNVLFIGSLFMENNLEAIKWYLKNVHINILKEEKNYKLIIAGSLGGVKKEKINKIFQGYDSVELYFDCENLSRLYSNASVFINPMQHGAGVKIKSINAIINGLPLVSTITGIEGIGLQPNKHFFLAKNKNEFKKAVLAIFNDRNRAREISKSAQEYLIKNNYLTVLNNELK